MPDTIPTSFDWNSILIAALAVLAVAGLITSLLLSRHLIKRPVESDRGFSYLTFEETRMRMLYCVSFFDDIYNSREMPCREHFEEFQLYSSVVASACKDSGVRDISSALRLYYLKGRPLPDYTGRYAQRLKEDSREGDVLAAFCLHARDEYSRLIKELSLKPDESSDINAAVL